MPTSVQDAIVQNTTQITWGVCFRIVKQIAVITLCSIVQTIIVLYTMYHDSYQQLTKLIVQRDVTTCK